MNNVLTQQLEFLKIADELKSVHRQTLLADKSRRENVAEHSWHIALMAMTLYEHSAIENVNLCRVLKMILVHDLVEIYAGDVPAFSEVNADKKMALEQQAADKLFSLLPQYQAKEYRGLWEEFDEMETPDAMYAAALDRFIPFLANHLTDGYTWVKFDVNAVQVYERIAPVKTVFPSLWEFVETVVSHPAKKRSCPRGLFVAILRQLLLACLQASVVAISLSCDKNPPADNFTFSRDGTVVQDAINKGYIKP